MEYSREYFSELCDISNSFLSEVERGNKSLTTKTLLKICNASHTTADYLLGISSDENEHSDDINYAVSLLSTMNVDQRSHAINILLEYSKALNDM